MTALPYLLAFLAGFAVDLIPALAPPAWPLLVLICATMDASPWLVAPAGVAGMVLGRYLLLLYVPRIGDRFLSRSQKESVHYLGERLRARKNTSLAFAFVASILPLSTTAFFTAAGLARIPPSHLLPGFAAAKLIAYSVLIYAGDLAVDRAATWQGQLLSWKALAAMAAGLVLLAAFLFIDWKTLLVEKRLAFGLRSRRPR